MRTVLVALLLGLAQAGAAAAQVPSLSFDRMLMAGAHVSWLDGARPGGGDGFNQLTFWLHVRGGVLTSEPVTDSGGQLGIEFGARVGLTPNETPRLDPEGALPLGFGLMIGLPIRVHAWSSPFYGALIVHVNAELEAGGARWWSDTARGGLMAGLRLVGAEGDVGFELDYTAVPLVLTGSPGGLEVHRHEQRVALTGSIGQAGFGLRFVYAFVELTAAPTVHDLTLTALAEWRL